MEDNMVRGACFCVEHVCVRSCVCARMNVYLQREFVAERVCSRESL